MNMFTRKQQNEKIHGKDEYVHTFVLLSAEAFPYISPGSMLLHTDVSLHVCGLQAAK